MKPAIECARDIISGAGTIAGYVGGLRKLMASRKIKPPKICLEEIAEIIEVLLNLEQLSSSLLSC